MPRIAAAVLAAALAVCAPAAAAAPSDARDCDARLRVFSAQLHAHPELSDREFTAAARMARDFAAPGCAVTVGSDGTGVAGLLANGSGPAIRTGAEALTVAAPGLLPGR